MKDKLTFLFKEIVNADCLAHARSLIIEFLSDNALTELDTMPQPRYLVIIRLGGKEVAIKSADYCKIASLLAYPKKIQAIKHLRMIAGAGLKDAKDAVCDFQNWPVTPAPSKY